MVSKRAAILLIVNDGVEDARRSNLPDLTIVKLANGERSQLRKARLYVYITHVLMYRGDVSLRWTTIAHGHITASRISHSRILFVFYFMQ